VKSAKHNSRKYENLDETKNPEQTTMNEARNEKMRAAEKNNYSHMYY
jgi:hypothetical protein